jgi:hypothetical protein
MTVQKKVQANKAYPDTTRSISVSPAHKDFFASYSIEGASGQMETVTWRDVVPELFHILPNFS